MRIGPSLLVVVYLTWAPAAWSFSYVSLELDAQAGLNQERFQSGQLPGPTVSNALSQTGVDVAATAVGSVGYGVVTGTAFAQAKNAGAGANVYGDWYDEFTFTGPSFDVLVTFTLYLSASATATGPTCGTGHCAFVSEELLVSGQPHSIEITTLSPGPAILQFSYPWSANLNVPLGVRGLLNGGASALSDVFSDITQTSQVDFSTTARVLVDVPAGFAYTTSSGTVFPSAVPEPSSLLFLALGAAGLMGVRSVRGRLDRR